MGEPGRKEGRERMKENEKELWGVARKLVLLVTEIVSADKKSRRVKLSWANFQGANNKITNL